MGTTLELAFDAKPDSAQFYPVMPYPGTGAYEYYRQNGYLATENFRDRLTEDGGHRCVLNLSGLLPEAIEQFCEKAYRKFHFRPRYLAYKLWQALRNPREGWRSLVAGMHFLAYLLTTKRGKQPLFAVDPKPVPSGWHSYVKVPMGRMERIKKGVELPLV